MIDKPANENATLPGTLPAEVTDTYFHWYSFSFACWGGSFFYHATTYIAYDEMKITKGRIMEAKKLASPDTSPGNMSLTAVCYLGFMTEEEFKS